MHAGALPRDLTVQQIQDMASSHNEELNDKLSRRVGEVLQCVAVCCSVLTRGVAVCCKYVAVCHGVVLQRFAVLNFNLLQCCLLGCTPLGVCQHV